MSAKTSRTILITGGTSGIGYEAALSIAKLCKDDHIILASRTDPQSAAASIGKITGNTNVEFMCLDLSKLDNVRAFVETWRTKNYPPIRALLLNAGLQIVSGLTYNDAGVEKTFAVNHLGHALLFYLLLPHFTPAARIVLTSSGTHDPAQKTGLPDAVYNTAEELAHPTGVSLKDSGGQRYASSKLVNIMWMKILARKFASAQGTVKTYTVNAFDPGLVPGTGLARERSAFIQFIWKSVLTRILPLLRFLLSSNIHTAQESGAALARLAVGADVEGVTGKYFEGMKIIKSSELSYDEEKQKDLYDWTAKFLAKDKEELGRFEAIVAE